MEKRRRTSWSVTIPQKLLQRANIENEFHVRKAGTKMAVRITHSSLLVPQLVEWNSVLSQSPYKSQASCRFTYFSPLLLFTHPITTILFLYWSMKFQTTIFYCKSEVKLTRRLFLLTLPFVTYCHVYECDYKRGLDWWSDLLGSLIERVTIFYNSQSHYSPQSRFHLPLLGSGFQRRTFSNSQTLSLTNQQNSTQRTLTNCPAYNISARTTHKKNTVPLFLCNYCRRNMLVCEAVT
jgi:hypothetical protein